MRMFAALVPPRAAAEDLYRFLNKHRRQAADSFGWSTVDHFHLTVVFAPDVPEHLLDQFSERLREAASRCAPIPTAIAGGGAFPDAGEARVLWAALDLDEVSGVNLGHLARDAAAAARETGSAVDRFDFHPHLTIAVLNPPQKVTGWVDLLGSYRGPAWTADTVSLFQSFPGAGPGASPHYEVVTRFPMGA